MLTEKELLQLAQNAVLNIEQCDKKALLASLNANLHYVAQLWEIADKKEEGNKACKEIGESS